MSRVRSAAIAAAIALFASGQGAAAQSVADFYRGKAIHLMVGAPAGGGYDVVGRMIATVLGKHIPGNPSVVVENIGAAAGLVMANTLYNTAPRDGTAIGLPTSAI